MKAADLAKWAAALPPNAEVILSDGDALRDLALPTVPGLHSIDDGAVREYYVIEDGWELA